MGITIASTITNVRKRIRFFILATGVRGNIDDGRNGVTTRRGAPVCSRGLPGNAAQSERLSGSRFDYGGSEKA